MWESCLTDANPRLYNWARLHTKQVGGLFSETKTEYFVFEPPDISVPYQASNHQASNSIQYPHTTRDAGGIVGSAFDQVLHVVEAICRNGCYSNKTNQVFRFQHSTGILKVGRPAKAVLIHDVKLPSIWRHGITSEMKVQAPVIACRRILGMKDNIQRSRMEHVRVIRVKGRRQ